ncbi:MAG: hypothetical protein ACOYMA_08145 [Bacteroidia bacterium]
MKKLITTIFLGLALAVMGEILAFYVYSKIDQGGILNGLIGITAFFSIFFGTIIISIYPEEYIKKNVRFKIKSNYLNFLIGSTLFIIFKLPFVLAIMIFYHFTGNYHDNQLKQFGIVKTVFIESEITGKNSRHDLCFQFNHNGKIWDGMLDAWQYQIGDSAQIIYSSQNPNETEWFNKYLEDKENENK